MKELKDKVAVITGGASGIGFSIARQAVLRGMKVVLADIEQAALDAAKGQLEKEGASVLAVKTDVTKPEQMQSLAKKTIETFGSVYLVVNNAGVGGVRGVDYKLGERCGGAAAPGKRACATTRSRTAAAAAQATAAAVAASAATADTPSGCCRGCTAATGCGLARV